MISLVAASHSGTASVAGSTNSLGISGLHQDRNPWNARMLPTYTPQRNECLAINFLQLRSAAYVDDDDSIASCSSPLILSGREQSSDRL